MAHGFAALTDILLTYLVDNYYDPEDELGLAWDDPAVGADWGVGDADPLGPGPEQPASSDIPDDIRPRLAAEPAARRPGWRSDGSGRTARRGHGAVDRTAVASAVARRAVR